MGPCQLVVARINELLARIPTLGSQPAPRVWANRDWLGVTANGYAAVERGIVERRVAAKNLEHGANGHHLVVPANLSVRAFPKRQVQAGGS
jgi:hypothetical protein